MTHHSRRDIGVLKTIPVSRIFFFFFQAEDGIRDAQESRGLGDVYKRQVPKCGRCDNHMKGSRSMQQITTIGLDLAKQVFQVHGAEADGSPVVSRKLRRADVLGFFKKLSPCLVGMEACGGAHFWARETAKLGHDVRLIPPSYVKPFVKRGKTDAADAEAICEAVIRKTMRFVPVKSADQQAAAMVLKTRELL